MVDLYELKQLTAFADLGTLSRVAEEFHISTPSVTRSMQHLEQYFGVPLFTRGKNRITLNETGRLAITHARKLLTEAEQAVEQVRAFDQRQRTTPNQTARTSAGGTRPYPQPNTQNAGSIAGKKKSDGQKTVARVGAIYLSRPSPAKYCRQK